MKQHWLMNYFNCYVFFSLMLSSTLFAQTQVAPLLNIVKIAIHTQGIRDIDPSNLHFNGEDLNHIEDGSDQYLEYLGYFQLG